MSGKDHGRFDWYELNTTDVDAALAWYTRHLAWEQMAYPTPMGTYWMVRPSSLEVPIGGLTTLNEQAKAMGAPAHWLGHIAVADVDVTAAEAVSRGGRALSPAIDIPEIGRIQVIQDPWGAVFALHAFPSDMAPARNPQPPGDVCWHELITGDIEGALAFYGALFGWEKGETHDMGPLGIYQIINRGGVGLGGMFLKPPGMPYGAWMYYVVVHDLDATVSAMEQDGATIVVRPHQIPDGNRIAAFDDPQGAGMALLGR